MRRLVVALTVGLLLASVIAPAESSPVARTAAEYTAYGRVFPDPHGCNVGQPGYSPWAKGNVCAVDFIQFDELIPGLEFMEGLEGFSGFMEVYELHKDFGCDGKPVADPKNGCKDFLSAGLPVTFAEGEPVNRERLPLVMVRVTDESVPNAGKDYFVFPLSIHGIERAGAEGGTRAIEDLVTWAACERNKNLEPCPNEGDIPHPVLEATPKQSLTAGEVLKKSVVYFIYPNPDGWNRGDRTTGTQFYQRYNGNGMDLNRDWPEQGYTFRPYTPWSEPESRSFGKVLQAIGPKDRNGNPKWTGGIDLHGQLADRAFSFTLIGGSERPYDKDQRVLQTVKGAYTDAEKRLAWSPVIKPNDAARDAPGVYGVQWGTIWDTIAYTVTGALGNWIDSPIGLNADGIDNEMSLSHLSNCGVGTCFDPDVEQLHVDGNKSLIYAMLNYSLLPESNAFPTKGRVGYLHNRGVVSEPTSRLSTPPKFVKYPPQKDIEDARLDPTNSYTYEFDVKGPKQNIYNGGLFVTITCANAQGVGPCAAEEARLEREKSQEENVQGEDWEVVATYFNQSSIYVQAGQALQANHPVPGKYRVRILGAGGRSPQGFFDVDIDFRKEEAWPDPGQVGYRATNMNFWKDLRPFTRPRIEKVTPRQIASTRGWKRRFDTIVVTNKVYPKLATKLKKWVIRQNGNLVLTDEALRMLEYMKLVAKGAVKSVKVYAGYINFATSSREETYKDRLATKINQPGAAEGGSCFPSEPCSGEMHRRQTYEPVPIGIAIQSANGSDANNAPAWYVSQTAWKQAKGRQRAIGTTVSQQNVSFGEITRLGGRVRIIGSLLPMPTKEFDNPFGNADYALTWAGYQVLQNVLQWVRPSG